MTSPREPGPLRRLAGRRALARGVIWFERLWPALWPAVGVAGAFVCLALLNIPRLLPPDWHLALLAGTAAAIAGLGWRGLRRVRAPDDAAADRRLERDSGLRHWPLAVLEDRPAQADAAGSALWQAHVARTLRDVRRLRVGLPHPGLAARDRHALRAALVVALIACLGIAGADAPRRLAGALEPSLPRLAAAPVTEVQAWITPPAYTRVAPVFLKSGGGTVSVPAGSRLTVSVTGGSGMPSLALDARRTPFRVLAKDSYQADRVLTQGGRLVVRRDGGTLAGWNLTVIADLPPVVAWSQKPGRSATGQEVRLPWTVADDYGVVSLQAELRLKDRPQAPPVIVPIPLPEDSPKSAHGVAQRDLTASPWAGLPVVARLVDRDALRQAGHSGAATFTLPERRFLNPVARVLVAIRKHLALHPNDRDTAVDALDKLIMHPRLFHGDIGAYVNLGALYYLFEYDRAPQAIPEAQARLWQLALHMEEGRTEQTARALEQARRAARDALNKALHDPSEANRKALEQALQALRQAIRQHMQALLAQARRRHQEVPFDPSARHMTGGDFERMAEAAQRAARHGDMTQAQQRLAELERMLDELRDARAGGGKAAQKLARERQRGRQQMGALQDMIARQGGLLDHTQGRAADDGLRQLGEPLAAQAADPAKQRAADQRVQQALRRALGELMQQFSDLTGTLPKGLGDADQAMQRAARQLGARDDRGAGANETRAIQDLQQGGQQMGQTMARQFGPGRQGEEGEAMGGSQPGEFLLQEGSGAGDGTAEAGQGQGRGQRDPLGRRYSEGVGGMDEGSDVRIPEHRAHQRTRAIEDELRRRDANRERPPEELDYYGRLLKGF